MHHLGQYRIAADHGPIGRSCIHINGESTGGTSGRNGVGLEVLIASSHNGYVDDDVVIVIYPRGGAGGQTIHFHRHGGVSGERVNTDIDGSDGNRQESGQFFRLGSLAPVRGRLFLHNRLFKNGGQRLIGRRGKPEMLPVDGKGGDCANQANGHWKQDHLLSQNHEKPRSKIRLFHKITICISCF